MIYPDVKLETWMSVYPTLKIMELECDNCGTIMASVRPFRSRHYVGMECYPCVCGKNKFTCSSAVTVTKEEHEEWERCL